MAERTKIALGALTGIAVLYAICVLGFVASSPDVRLRFLLEPAVGEGAAAGLQLRAVNGLVTSTEHLLTTYPDSFEPTGRSQRPPQRGDVVLEIDDQRMGTFLDFARQINRLRSPAKEQSQILSANDEDPANFTDLYPPTTAAPNGTRYVRVHYRPVSGEAETVWLKVQSVPWGELVVSLTWFLCQLGVLLAAALAAWNRPLDRAPRVFLAMSIVATFAFMGGFHWWLIAANMWLNTPFLVSAILLPAVTLHFFLEYPKAKPFTVHRPWTTFAVLYVVPVLAAVAAVGLTWAGHVTESGSWIVGALRWLVRGYLLVAVTYFAATLVALVHGFATTRNPIERVQVKWILAAAMVSTVPLAYTLYLALFARDDFAAGRARLPMFLASLSFLLAYTVGIVRYQMMLAAQFVTRGIRYYVVSAMLMLMLALAVTVSVVLGVGFPNTATRQQVLAMSSVLFVTTTLLIWLRDRFQGLADRTFFSEKYRLDEALQQMNADGGQLADPGALGQRMLRTCREVLRVEWAALLFREGQTHRVRLIAADGVENVPVEIELDADAIEELRVNGTSQRVRGAGDDGHAVRILRQLGGDLLHPFHVERRLAGIVVLGPKLEGAGFSAEDVTFLHALGQITSVALHGAHVHQELGLLNEQLRAKVDTVVRQQRQIALLRAELDALDGTSKETATNSADGERSRGGIRGTGPAIERVLETAWKVADSEVSVLVRGESGTGKELVAQVLHENSPRRSGPLVRVNCAALSPTLLESELFGHVKGAFTGAHRDRVGRFEAADGGTLFLDEIGDVSLETQVKLLRVVQERRFERVGGTQTIEVDVRLVAATHQDLERLIREGRFREDLYYRLNVVTVSVPPLRDRVEDLPELFTHFVRRSCERTGKKVRGIDEDAWAKLEAYRWPGNVRELQNVAERAVVLADGSSIGLRELPAEITSAEPPRRAPKPSSRSGVVARTVTRAIESDASPVDWQPPTDIDEHERLLAALEQAGGNKTRAAQLLGMPRSTYYSKLRKYSVG